MRVDKFFVQKWRESHGAIQELTSQIQEMQEIVNYVCDSRDFQDVPWWRYFPRSLSTDNRSKSLWDAEPRPKSAT